MGAVTGAGGDKPRPDRSRAGALRLLDAVATGQTLDEAAGVIERLAPAEKARARRLALETLRRVGRLEPVLDKHLARRPRPEILMLLRLATVELLALGEAPHGVVNAAVALARGMGQKGQAAAGMVNAVLRKVADEGALWASLTPQEMPDWLREPVVAAWGEEVAQAIEAAHEAGASLDLTAKPGREAPGEALPTGSHRLPVGTQVSALAGYEAGDWWVQDAAAALAAVILDPRPGERIADLCAAPGGKTMQLAAAGAEVTAIDISEHRLARVAENLARCGLSATLVASDALEWQAEAPLDAVLLDAPCSATGTIRRHPDLPLIRDDTEIPEIVALQAELIDHALEQLKPGGRLVYATCSLLPAEGEEQIRAALARHPGLTVEPPTVPGIAPEWITPEGGLRLRPDLWPERGGMDGFYIARLRLAADAT
ncbi:RsmB/NOP family class I SAM-dependent RNA methyltransferase [Paracoccus aminophilus]|nr:transcription antitermination factor NusB [Paracoccus aminophilus]